MITLIAIAVFGAIGALIRYHFGGFVHTSVNSALASEKAFPFGTLFVNVIGSLILGFLTGVALHHGMYPLVMVALGTGFCGALTTFSTLAVDVQRFLRDRRYVHALMDVLLSHFAGAGAAWAGFIMTGN